MEEKRQTYGRRRKRKADLYTKKYYAKRTRSVGTTKFIGPVRPNQKFNFKYAQKFSLNPSSGGLAAVQIFSANGLYDPDISGIGHQPMGFDQIQAFYDHHVVIASKVKVWFSSRDGNIYDNIVSIHVMDDVGPETDIQTTLERPLGVNQMLKAGEGTSPVCLELGVNPIKYLGKKTYDDDQLEGSVSSNPNEGVYFHVSAAPIQAVDAGQIDCYAVIEYVALMIEPRNIPAS